MANAEHTLRQNQADVNSPSVAGGKARTNFSGKVRDIMRSGLVTVRRDNSMYEAIGVLVERHISGLPVVDETRLVGIISEKDALRLLCEQPYLSGAVQDYMTRDVVCCDEDDDIADVCTCLVANDFRRVPVLYQGKLTGIVTRADLIRHYRRQSLSVRSKTGDRNEKATVPAKHVMTRGLLTVQTDTPIVDVVDMLATKAVTGLPVVDEGMHLTGIVSEKDVLRCLCDTGVESKHVRDIMAKDVVAFDENDSLFLICDCLIRSGFRRVPILSNGRLAGIVSRADIILYILKNKSAFFKAKANRPAEPAYTQVRG